MEIRAWTPKGKKYVCRLYFKDGSGRASFISSKKQALNITSDDTVNEKLVDVFLKSHQVDYRNFNSVHALNYELEKLGIINKDNIYKESKSLTAKTPKQLYDDSLNISVDDIAFKDPSFININVDQREKESLIEELKRTHTNINRSELDGESVRISHQNALNMSMVIKIIRHTSFKQSIETQKCYKSIEIYRQLIDKLAVKGVTLKMIWVFESDLDNQGQPRSFFDSHENIKELDGFIDTVIAANQNLVHSLSTTHTAAIVASLIKRFFDEPPAPVAIDEEKLDLLMKDYLSGYKAIPTNEVDAGEVDYECGLSGILTAFPLIDKNIAKNLAMTGKNLNQITAMSKSELLAVTGIGNQKATIIANLFNNTY